MLDLRRPTSSASTFDTAPGTSARFGGIRTGELRPVNPEADIVALVHETGVADLRKTFRRLVARLGAVVLVGYLGYVTAVAYVPQFMSTPLFGAVNVGLVLALAQFAMVLLVATLYARAASRQLDPKVDAIHDIVAEGSRS